MLKKTQVQEAIANAMAERSKRTGINQDRIVQELVNYFRKLQFKKLLQKQWKRKPEKT